MRNVKKTISVIVPVKNEAGSIPALTKRIVAVFKKLPNYQLELIYVDDGSTDDSVAEIQRLQIRNKNIRLINLARNFGKEVALTAGLKKSTGQLAVMIDADLQHPPELIPKLLSRWEAGYDVVIGTRRSNGHTSSLKNITSRIFYRIMNRISVTEFIPHATDFRLIDRVVINEFNRLTERNRMTRNLIDWLGFSRTYVPFEPAKRLHGQPSYTLRKLFQLSVQAIISSSLFPLRLAGYLGSIIVLFSVLLGSFMYVEGILLNDPMQLDITGTAYLTVLIIFLIGIVLACLGIIALYIAAIHGEVMNRPLYIEKPNPTPRR